MDKFHAVVFAVFLLIRFGGFAQIILVDFPVYFPTDSIYSTLLQEIAPITHAHLNLVRLFFNATVA